MVTIVKILTFVKELFASEFEHFTLISMYQQPKRGLQHEKEKKNGTENELQKDKIK